MARYIDSDKMREEWLVNGENEYVYDTNSVLDSIDAQPTADVVEVVRCKDCVNSHFSSSSLRYSCYRESNHRHVEEDGFCNYGKLQKRSSAE